MSITSPDLGVTHAPLANQLTDMGTLMFALAFLCGTALVMAGAWKLARRGPVRRTRRRGAALTVVAGMAVLVVPAVVAVVFGLAGHRGVDDVQMTISTGF